MADAQKQGLSTLALHAGYDPLENRMSSQVPIYMTSSYNFKDTDHAAGLFELSQFGHIYSRLGNPTCDVLEQRLAAMDGGAAGLTFSSGMAAITTAILTLAKSGQNIVSCTGLYGGTYTLFTQTLKNLGIEVRFFDSNEPEKISELIDENTRCVYIESQGNPKNDIVDFETVTKLAHDAGVPVMCDNTVLTPVMFRPIEVGVDIVVYSATKYIGGHGAHVGGLIIDSGNFDWSKDPEKWSIFCKPDPSYHGVVFSEAVGNLAFIIYARTHALRDMGSCMSPMAAWVFLMGLETLPLRMKQHCNNTLEVAQWLEKHDCVDWVNYSGLESSPYYANACKYFPKGKGAVIGFGIKGGKEAGAKFINSVKLAMHLANIGDARTLVIHPASTTHQQLTDEEQLATGVTPEYVRLCVGIEDAEDIIADLDQALKASQK